MSEPHRIQNLNLGLKKVKSGLLVHMYAEFLYPRRLS